MLLVDPELTAPRGRPPIDVPDAIARDERAKVGEFDPLRFLARDMVAAEDLCLGRPQEGPHSLLAREHLDRRTTVLDPFPGRKAEHVASTQEHAADAKRSPARADEPVAKLARLAVAQENRRGVLTLEELDVVRQLDEDVQPVDADRRIQPDNDLDLVPLER